MKTIENRKVEIKVNPDGESDYKFLISLAVNAPKQGGFTVQEMKDRIKLLGALDESQEIVELEDADFKLTKKLVNEFKWQAFHQEFVDFVDYINSL